MEQLKCKKCGNTEMFWALKDTDTKCMCGICREFVNIPEYDPIEILRELVNNKKKTGWVKEYQPSDEDAFSMLMANFFDWNGKRILRACILALEDSNYHTLIKRIMTSYEKEYGEKLPIKLGW